MYDFSNPKEVKFNSTGDGFEYFKIFIINWILTIITLGFYYPWAKEKQYKYLYSTINIDGDPLSFHGTGMEMFKGLLKALLIIVLLYALMLFFVFVINLQILGVLSIYAGIAMIFPLALHGSMRYRFSRSSWRGIRMKYTGDKKVFILLFLKWIFMTIITLGFYSSWMTINMRNYLLSHVSIGDVKLKYQGDGSDYFFINLTGYPLTILSLGVYYFWWKRDQFNYFVNNLRLEREGNLIMLHSQATPKKIFNLLSLNFIMLVFSLGLAYPWVAIRNINFVIDNVTLQGNLDLDTIAQNIDDYENATGEYMTDFFDIDLI